MRVCWIFENKDNEAEFFRWYEVSSVPRIGEMVRADNTLYRIYNIVWDLQDDTITAHAIESEEMPELRLVKGRGD